MANPPCPNPEIYDAGNCCGGECFEQETPEIIAAANAGTLYPPIGSPMIPTSAGLEAGQVFDVEPNLAADFGPERSIRWIVTWFYKHHMNDEKGAEIASRYFDALAARSLSAAPEAGKAVVEALRASRTFVIACRAEAKGRNTNRYDHANDLISQIDAALSARPQATQVYGNAELLREMLDTFGPSPDGAVERDLAAALASPAPSGATAKDVRQIIFDALDLSEELRVECTVDVVNALEAAGVVLSAPQAVPAEDIAGIVADLDQCAEVMDAAAKMAGVKQVDYRSRTLREAASALTSLSAERNALDRRLNEEQMQTANGGEIITDLKVKLAEVERQRDAAIAQLQKTGDVARDLRFRAETAERKLEEARKALEALADDLAEVKFGDQIYRRTSLSKDSIARTVAEIRRIASLSERKGQDGLWPNWGDSPNGFDGPTGAE